MVSHLHDSFHSFVFWSILLLNISLSCCCCLPTPMALASGGSPMFPLVVHQPASPSIWPAVQSLRRGMSTNPGATMWCVCGCSCLVHIHHRSPRHILLLRPLFFPSLSAHPMSSTIFSSPCHSIYTKYTWISVSFVPHTLRSSS